jgi:hypothetical protein
MSEWIKEKLKELLLLYGLETFIKLEHLIKILRPFLPLIVKEEDLIPIALSILGMLVPLAVGSAVMAADVLAKVSIFGVKAGVTTVKATYVVTKTTAEVAADLFIKKPLYLLSYPFRKKTGSKEMDELLGKCELQESELAKYRKAYG